MWNCPGEQDDRARKLSGLSLHPLSLEEALGGAMATGKPPEPVPQNKHAKRTATKRRLVKEDAPVKTEK